MEKMRQLVFLLLTVTFSLSVCGKSVIDRAKVIDPQGEPLDLDNPPVENEDTQEIQEDYNEELLDYAEDRATDAGDNPFDAAEDYPESFDSEIDDTKEEERPEYYHDHILPDPLDAEEEHDDLFADPDEDGNHEPNEYHSDMLEEKFQDDEPDDEETDSDAEDSDEDDERDSDDNHKHDYLDKDSIDVNDDGHERDSIDVHDDDINLNKEIGSDDDKEDDDDDDDVDEEDIIEMLEEVKEIDEQDNVEEEKGDIGSDYQYDEGEPLAWTGAHDEEDEEPEVVIKVEEKHFPDEEENDNDEDDDDDDEEKSDTDDTNDDDDDDDESKPLKVEFRPVSLPTDFDSYDVLERDGVITLDELANVTGARDHVMDAFHDTDANDDGVVTLEEFLEAPWVLGGIPEENAAPAELVEYMEEDIEQMSEAKEDLGKKSERADKVLDKLIDKEVEEENEVIRTASQAEQEAIKVRRRKSHWNSFG